MEIVDNAHSYSAPDVPITSKESNVPADVPMDTNEAVKNNSSVELPLSIYEEIKGSPYTIEYLSMNSELFNDRTMLRDGETIKMARAIDEFVSNEIERKNLTDSLDSYHSIIEHIKSVLKIDINEQSSSMLKKIYTFIKQYRGMSAFPIKI